MYNVRKIYLNKTKNKSQISEIVLTRCGKCCLNYVSLKLNHLPATLTSQTLTSWQPQWDSTRVMHHKPARIGSYLKEWKCIGASLSNESVCVCACAQSVIWLRVCTMSRVLSIWTGHGVFASKIWAALWALVFNLIGDVLWRGTDACTNNM